MKWRRATALDVPQMVALSDQNYSEEFEHTIFTKNLTRLHYHLHQAVLTQTYSPTQTCVLVAGNTEISAWSWLERGKFTPYSDDEMAVAEIIHMELDLSTRKRIDLIRELLLMWEIFCIECKIPVLVSTSIRADQSAFMRLHQRVGFQVRGSMAYKKLKGE
jgi:hypothetical protein